MKASLMIAMIAIIVTTMSSLLENDINIKIKTIHFIKHTISYMFYARSTYKK